MKIQLAAKFQKKTDGRLSRISPDIRTDARTDRRTDATENNGPSPINRGTLRTTPDELKKSIPTQNFLIPHQTVLYTGVNHYGVRLWTKLYV